MLYSIPGYDLWATSGPPEYDDDYPTRCEGTRHHKCGRFLAYRSAFCARCAAEIDEDLKDELAREIDLDKYQREQQAIDLWYDEPTVYDEYADLYDDGTIEYNEGYSDDLDF